MKGSCFCEEVIFEVLGVEPVLYQCHCSMCRKVTSSSCNTAYIVPQENFKWLSKIDNIQSFTKPSGYRVDFCKCCGSPVPNLFGENDVWVPAGLLDEDYGLEISNHLCVSSKASWDEISGKGKKHKGVPELQCIKSS